MSFSNRFLRQVLLKIALSYVFIFCLSGIKLFCQSTQIIISGTVSDYIKPIAYASIVFSFENKQFFTLSSIKGTYSIAFDVKSTTEKILLTVSAVGHRAFNEQIAISNSSINPYNICLQVKADTLVSVIVLSKRPVEMRGDTISFQAKAFTNGNEKNLGELLKNMPGFEVNEKGKIFYNNKPVERLLIEDDDLSGKDYGTITNNFSVKPIEQIDLIANYKSANDIFENLGRGTQLAINIKLKNNYKAKVFGEINGGIGYGASVANEAALSLNYFEKNAKLLSTPKLNNTGKIFEDVNESSNNASNKWEEANDFDASIYNLNQNLNPINKNKGFNNVYENNSIQSPTYLLFRPNKKIVANVKFNYLNDHFLQSQTETLIINNQTFSDTQTNAAAYQFRYTKYMPEFTLYYTPATNLQFKLQYGDYVSTIIGKDIGEIQRFKHLTNLTRKEEIGWMHLAASKLLKKNAALKLEATKDNFATNNLFNSSYQPLVNTFFQQTSIAQLSAEDAVHFSKMGLLLSYKKINPQSFYKISVSYSAITGNYGSNLIANPTSPITVVRKDSLNNSQLNQKVLTALLENNLNLRKQTSIFFRINITNQTTNAFHFFNHKTISNTRFFVTPEVSFRKKITKYLQLGIGNTLRYLIPNNQQLLTGVRINDITSLASGSGQFSDGFSFNSQFNLSYYELKENIKWFFINSTYTTNDQLYLPNQINNSTILKVDFLPTNAARFLFINNISTGIRFSNNFKISANVSHVFGNAYFSNMNNIQKNKFSISKVELNTAIPIKSAVLTATNGFESYKQILSSNTVATKNFTIINKINLLCNFNQSAQFAISYSNYFPFSGSKKLGDAHFLDFEISKSLPNNKITFFTNSQNLFNQKNYTSISQSQNFYRISTTQLFPRIIVLGAKYNF